MEAAEFANVCRQVYLEENINLTEYYPDNILSSGTVEPEKIFPARILALFNKHAELGPDKDPALNFSENFDFIRSNDKIDQIKYGKELLANRVKENVSTGKSILSIGIGNGTLAKDYFTQGLSITGIDMHKDFLKTASTMIPYITVIEADLNKSYPQLIKKFDAAECSMTAHHIKDLDKLIKFCSRKIMKGGRFFMLDLVDKTKPEEKMTFMEAHKHPAFHGIEFIRPAENMRRELSKHFTLEFYERIGPGLAYFECVK